MFVDSKFLVNSVQGCARTIAVIFIAFISTGFERYARDYNDEIPAVVCAAVIAAAVTTIGSEERLGART
jgi:hypothetical protein